MIDLQELVTSLNLLVTFFYYIGNFINLLPTYKEKVTINLYKLLTLIEQVEVPFFFFIKSLCQRVSTRFSQTYNMTISALA